MQKKFVVATVGDAIMDVFLGIDHPSEFCSPEEKTHMLHILSGSKILVDTAAFCLGGNASNVAVGLQRLGYTTALIAELGDDIFGQEIVKELQQQGIALDYTIITKDAPSTFSVGIQMQQERTLFVKHVTRSHAMRFADLQTDWLYVTSVGKDWQALYARIATYKQEHPHVRIAFNPGSQQFADGVATFKDILTITDILFVNREEAEQILYGHIPPEKKENEENMLFRITRAGPKIVCMTDGENGSYAMDEKGELLFHPIVEPIEHVGKTGAGDSYAVGFLAAYIEGKSVKEAMHWGTQEAIAVIGHIGAQTGLLTKEQLLKKVHTNV